MRDASVLRCQCTDSADDKWMFLSPRQQNTDLRPLAFCSPPPPSPRRAGTCMNLRESSPVLPGASSSQSLRPLPGVSSGARECSHSRARAYVGLCCSREWGEREAERGQEAQAAMLSDWVTGRGEQARGCDDIVGPRFDLLFWPLPPTVP